LARHTTGVAKCIHVPVTKLNLDLRERMMICLESTLDATINSSDDYIIGTATADDILQKLGSGSRREVIASA